MNDTIDATLNFSKFLKANHNNIFIQIVDISKEYLLDFEDLEWNDLTENQKLIYDILDMFISEFYKENNEQKIYRENEK